MKMRFKKTRYGMGRIWGKPHSLAQGEGILGWSIVRTGTQAPIRERVRREGFPTREAAHEEFERIAD